MWGRVRVGFRVAKTRRKVSGSMSSSFATEQQHIRNKRYSVRAENSNQIAKIHQHEASHDPRTCVGDC